MWFFFTKYQFPARYSICSLPLPVLYEMVKSVKARMIEKGVLRPEAPSSSPVTEVLGYGHIGDGNLHLNVSAREYSPQVSQLLEPYVYEFAQKYNGSVSAEHGLGQAKVDYVHYSKSPEMIAWIKKIKRVFDPQGIMNPYKYLPADD